MEERRNRFIYSHRLSLTHENEIGRGEIIDWSSTGIHFISGISLKMKTDYKVCLHILQDKGLEPPVEIWRRDGAIRWMSYQEKKLHVGIELDEPIEEIAERIEEIDFCYLFIQS